MRIRDRESIVVAALVAITCVVLWQRLWTGSQTLFLWDDGTYFHPMKSFLAETVRSGEWPWWNPWIRNGLPFFANPQVGLFYPPSVLFYVLPTALAFNWNVILHCVLMATGFYGWLRCSGRTPAAAALGGLLVAWGGYALSMAVYLNNLQAMAWIGWTWWAWERWLARRTPRWLALTAIGFGLIFLAGEPQVAVMTAGIALLRAWTGDLESERARPGRLISALALVVAALGAMLATAVQLVPTLELFGLSQRSLGLEAGESLGWSVEPAQLYNLLVPRYFETPAGLFDFRRIPGVVQPWVFTSYLGIVAIVLAAAGIDRRHPRRGFFWLGIAAAGVFLALGEHNPVVAAIANALPAARVFRFPEKSLLLTAIAVPVLTALGFDALRERSGARWRALAVAIVLAAAAALAWALAAGAGIDALVSGFRHVFLFAIMATLLLAAARRLSFPILGACLALLAVLDPASVNPQVAPVASAELFARTPAVLEGLPLEELRTRTRIRTSALGEHPGLTFTMPGITSATNQYYQLNVMGGNLAVLHRVLAQDGAEPFPPRINDTQDAILRELPLAYQVRYLRLLSTGWVVERPLESAGLEPEDAIEELGLIRYRVTDPLPRAYMVTRASVEPDSIAILNRFMAGGEDPHRIAYLSERPALDGPLERIEGGVRWLPGSNHSVRLEVDAPSRVLLVLTDAWYPGWVVAVDGQRAPLRRVNWQFKGVMLEPGTHRVRFDYRPRGIAAGAVASAIGVLVLTAAVAVGGRSRGREA